MKVYDSVDWVVGRCVGYEVGRGVGDELYSGVGDEVGEVYEFELGGQVVSINMSNMKLMWRFET